MENPSTTTSVVPERPRNKVSFIVGSRQKNNKRICTDKYSFYEHDIPDTQLFKTLDPELTTSEKVLEPFWNLQCKEISEKLSLPTKTVSVELGLNSLNGSSKGAADALSLSVTLPEKIEKSTGERILLPSSLCSPQENTGVENTVNEKIPTDKKKLNTIRYKLKLTSSQKYALYNVGSKLRALENEVRAFVNNNDENTHRFDLKHKFVSPGATGITDPDKRDRINTLPFDTRDQVIIRVDANNRARISNEQNGNNKRGGKFSFRSFKNEVKNGFTIEIPKSNIPKNKSIVKDNGIYRLRISKMFGVTPMKMKLSNKEKRSFIPSPSRHGLKITRDPFGNFFVFIPYRESEIPPEQSSPVRQLAPPLYQHVSLDPGARDLLTGYSMDGGFSFTLNFLDRKKVKRLEIERDKYRSLYDTETDSRKKYRFYHLWKMRITKLKNLSVHFRRHARRFLAENFQEIAIGFFNGSFVMTGQNKTTKKALSQVGHYKLRHSLYELSDRRLIATIHEAYTSKTCCQCGRLNHDLGASKVFKCVSGKCAVIDRDVNGAINIGIKRMIGKSRKRKRTT